MEFIWPNFKIRWCLQFVISGLSGFSPFSIRKGPVFMEDRANTVSALEDFIEFCEPLGLVFNQNLGRDAQEFLEIFGFCRV